MIKDGFTNKLVKFNNTQNNKILKNENTKIFGITYLFESITITQKLQIKYIIDQNLFINSN